ncbi:MAG: hypothetical protein U0166_03740 [Acidobacteriota bacterium]
MEARSSAKRRNFRRRSVPTSWNGCWGGGGYGAVHVARHATTGTVVALKTVTVPSSITSPA